jgi:hypothetical protein
LARWSINFEIVFVEDCATSAARNRCRKQFLLTENNVTRYHQKQPCRRPTWRRQIYQIYHWWISHWHGRRRGAHLRHYRHCAYRLFLWMSWLD